MPLRTLDFRLVTMQLGYDQSRIQWHSWEPMREGSVKETTTFPAMRAAFSFLRTAHEYLKHTGLYDAPAGRLGSIEMQYSRTTFGEMLERALVELSCWLGDVPAVQDTPSGGVVRAL